MKKKKNKKVMYYKKKFPTDIKEGAWDEKSCVRRIAGFTIDETNLPSTLKWLPKGTPLVLLTNGMVSVCKTAKVYEKAAQAATTLKVNKGSLFMVGDKIAGSTISKVDESSSDFTKLTISVLENEVEANAVVDDGNASKVIGLNYATVELDGQQSCTPTLQAYEIDEDSLPYPINEAIKEALTVTHKYLIKP